MKFILSILFLEFMGIGFIYIFSVFSCLNLDERDKKIDEMIGYIPEKFICLKPKTYTEKKATKRFLISMVIGFLIWNFILIMSVINEINGNL